MSVIPARVIMVLNTLTIACFARFSWLGIMESRKLIGKNIAKIIKSIWLNNIMPVSKNTNIDIVNIGLHFFLKNVRPYAASCSEA